MSSKHFVADSFMQNPQRYGTDDGDLNIVNDYFSKHGWALLTREQFAAISTLSRERRKFLEHNPNFDLRKKNKPIKFVQLSIYDYLDADTANQAKAIIGYLTADSSRLAQSNDEIKKSIGGIDEDHITATRVMLPLLISEPQLKKVKIG